MVLFSSTGGGPLRVQGPSQFDMEGTQRAYILSDRHVPYWIEAAISDTDGTVFAWYHHEPRDVCPTGFTIPKIGALVSHDGGQSFEDLGIILESSEPAKCDSLNGFFAGGHGDFSVVLDPTRQFYYFNYTNYGGPRESQGVAMARMAYEDRFDPVGKVYKFDGSDWTEPGVGGKVLPMFPAKVAWERPDADSFWGPSVHWNTYLERWVMLLNRSCCASGWPQEGIYVSFSDDITNPNAWTQPEKILGAVAFPNAWYPQVLGLEPGGTDKEAGEVARFYLRGISVWEIVFHK